MRSWLHSEGFHHAPPADVLGRHVSYRHHQWTAYGFGLRIWSRRQHAATVDWLQLWAEACQFANILTQIAKQKQRQPEVANTLPG